MAYHIFIEESKHNYKRLGIDANIMLAEPTQHLKEKEDLTSHKTVYSSDSGLVPFSKLVEDLMHQLARPPLLLQPPKDSGISLFP